MMDVERATGRRASDEPQFPGTPAIVDGSEERRTDAGDPRDQPDRLAAWRTLQELAGVAS